MSNAITDSEIVVASPNTDNNTVGKHIRFRAEHNYYL